MADGFTIDLTEFKSYVGSRVPEDDYNVVVEDSEFGKSSKKGTPQVTVWFRVIDGPEEGATIIDNLYLTEKSLFRVVGFLQAIGIPTPKKKFKVPHKAIRGRKLTITVEDGEPWNGRVKSEVRAYMKFRGDESADEVDDLDDVTADDSDDEDVEEVVAAESVDEPESDDSPDDDDVEEIDLDDIDL